MHISTRYTELVGIEHPVVQDGLGLSPTAKLAAAVSEAGGLGTVSIPAVSADLEANRAAVPGSDRRGGPPDEQAAGRQHSRRHRLQRHRAAFL